MKKKNILLLEPGYKNKYPPLGLMKLAQYHRKQNKNHHILFAKGGDHPDLTKFRWDRIYVTTLFSFEWKKTSACIDKAIELAEGRRSIIFVGGISASLMTDQFEEVARWKGVRFIAGILKDSPARSLGLGYRDFGRQDITTMPIDEMVPDYSILEHIEYEYPVRDAYFGYASRGCIRKCSFCGVPKLEGEQKDMPPLTGLVQSIDALYGPKKDLVLMDNNVTAAPRFNEIVAEIRDLGFTPGTKLARNGQTYKRRVDFNQGVDARLLSKNPGLIKQLATIGIDPLRIAFDHLGLRKPYERAIRDAAAHDITSLSNYMLYNFHDTPEDLYRRLVVNIALNEELEVRIWSFPMRYQPVTFKDRSFVGKNWNKYFLRSFQIMLQASQGLVSGNPVYFNHAYGASVDEFIRLLWLPHQFIFHREYFSKGPGQPVLDEYTSQLGRFTQNERDELMTTLNGDPGQPGLWPSKYKNCLSDASISRNVREIMRIYAAYGATRGDPSPLNAHKDFSVPDDKKVEDAGLYEDPFNPVEMSPSSRIKPAFKEQIPLLQMV